jgi:ferritin-like metal-binding protein YciE
MMDTADEKNHEAQVARDHDIATAAEFFRLQLRTALAMEIDSLGALAELRSAGVPHETTALLEHHAEETRGQIDNLHQIFASFDVEARPEPSPASAGIRQQGGILVGRCASDIREQAVLSAALGNENYEIGCYQGLITVAEALDAGEAAQLLQRNLEQEVHTGEELRRRLQIVG